MPNYICNKLEIKDEETRKKVIEYMHTRIPAGEDWLGFKYDEYNTYMDFEKIIPMPDYIYRGALSSREEDLYGPDNCWYHWSLKHWGTKWNACDSCIDDDERMEFLTAWNGVPALMGILSQKFPDSEFVYRYADEDFGHNNGYYRFKNGSVIENRNTKDNSADAFLNYHNCYGLPNNQYVTIDRLGNASIVISPVKRI